jgi:Ca-activated chloride channel family protein
MRFAASGYLLGIFLGLGLLILGLWWQSRQAKKWHKVFRRDIWDALTSDLSPKHRRLKAILYYLSFVFVCLALARPQLGSSLQATKSLGVELIIALDVSESMLAEDNKPSRLQFAKSEINRLVDRLGGDNLGLVAFAGSAFLVSPITTDKGAIKLFLDGLSPLSVSSQGTNVAEALKSASEAFERGGREGEDGVQKPTRVVLVASDGEDHEEGAIKLAKDLASKGVRIYAWGFGTEKGAPIPRRDEFGNLRDYKKDPSGRVIVSTAKDKFLRDLAAAGQGVYVHAFFGGNAPETLEKALNQLQKTEFETQTSMMYDEKFQIPLAIALLFFALAMWVSDRRERTERVR